MRISPGWNEPTKEFIKALEMAGKINSHDDLDEISSFVRKVGTNRLIADKTVFFDFQKPFDFTASFLSSHTHARSASPVETDGSSGWCVCTRLLERISALRETNEGIPTPFPT